MGAAASVDQLPEKLSEEDLKTLCGNKFDPSIYKSMHDEDGLVGRDQFLEVVSDSLEKEVLQVFRLYCPHGEIDSQTFLKLCRDARLMNKNNFSTADCTEIFNKAKNHGSSKFSTFRRKLIPEIAAKKGIDEQRVVFRIACVDDPVPHKILKSQTDKGSIPENGEESDNPAPLPVPDEHHRAALKLQTLQRKKTAVKMAEGLREMREATAATVDPAKDFDHAKEDSELEKKAKESFNIFAEDGEIDSRGFFKLCIESKMLEKKFTSLDIEHVFQMSKAKACAPGAGDFSKGVLYGKRITYEVFRGVTVPLLATKKDSNIDAILELIATRPGITASVKLA